MKFSFKAFSEGKRYIMSTSTNPRVFGQKLRRLRWEVAYPSVWLRVDYGKGEFNEGIYNNKKDFDFALNVFKKEKI